MAQEAPTVVVQTAHGWDVTAGKFIDFLDGASSGVVVLMVGAALALALIVCIGYIFKLRRQHDTVPLSAFSQMVEESSQRLAEVGHAMIQTNELMAQNNQLSIDITRQLEQNNANTVLLARSIEELLKRMPLQAASRERIAAVG